MAPSLEDVWRMYDAIESRLTASVSERMLDLAQLAPGMHVLDLATGRGEPAVRAAQRAGETGRVLGLDPSEALLAMAREKADRAGVRNLELRAIDADALDAIDRFDVATVRWGLQAMKDPVKALSRTQRALKKRGVLVAALWAEPERVPFYTLPRRLLERYRALAPIDLEAPGTFRFGHMQRVERDFVSAGFAIEHVEELDVPVIEADTAAGIVAWVRAVLGYTPLLDPLPVDVQRRWEDDLSRAVQPVLRLGGVTRIVVARSAA